MSQSPYAVGRNIPASQLPAGMDFATNPISAVAGSAPGWLGSLGRIAGAGFDIFRTATGASAPGFINSEFIKESTKKLEKEQDKYLGNIQDTFGRISRIATGDKAVSDVVQDYYDRFSNFMDKAYAQGRQDLEADYALGDQYYNRLQDSIGKSLGYSLLRNPVYEAAYKAPDAVAPVDVEAIKNVMTLDASDPEQYKKFAYSQPGTQALIQGRPDAISQYAAFFSSKPSQDLMKYTV